ncbi:MAG: hypothetical protein JST04_09595 [Bdellovibrionales bacterium]|nr:hypothetical protein [Bdellovibrionales bacterium]
MNYLIRTKENRISGPFPKETIVARMQSGELREMDEVCPATGYWIYLHERDESIKMLGVALARSDEFHEESTETDTETVTATAPVTAPYAAANAKEMIHAARESVAASTTHLPEASKQSATVVPAVSSSNRPERMRALKLLLWAFVGLIIFIVIQIFQLANRM